MRRTADTSSLSGYSYAIVAVSPRALITAAELERNFAAVGYQTTQRLRFTQVRADGAIVLAASRIQSTNPSSSVAGQHPQGASAPVVGLIAVGLIAVASTLMLNRRPPTPTGQSTAPRRSRVAFQSVWDIPRWATTGLELLIADDNDAGEQLDALARGLDRSRSELEIKPQAGWCGYGHPDLYGQCG